MFKTIKDLETISEYTAFIQKIKNKKNYLNDDKTINYEAIQKDEDLFPQLYAIMTKKIINDNFKKCPNNCPDDNALATMLWEEEKKLYKPNERPSSKPNYFTTFLTYKNAREKIKAAKDIFNIEDDINQKKTFITVLLNTAFTISRDKAENLKFTTDDEAIAFFTTEFKKNLDTLIAENKLYKLEWEESTNRTKTTRPSSWREKRTAAALFSLPPGANPYEAAEEEFGFGPESEKNDVVYDFASSDSNPSSNRD